ncbi:MAG: hypothetical protein J6W31_03475 [Clostridia bacterium]|nr:hypothetical protein [Clostridia bacterium]
MSCMLALASCGEEETSKNEDASSAEEVSVSKEYVLAEGYKLFDKDGVSFAYPKGWTLTDGSNPIMMDTNGNNINVVYETATKQNTETYKKLSKSTFMDLLGNYLEAMGMEIGDYSVEKKTNGGDVEIICLAYSVSMQGVGMKMYQYIILGEKKHYTVTVTEMTDIDDVIDEVFKSIRID